MGWEKFRSCGTTKEGLLVPFSSVFQPLFLCGTYHGRKYIFGSLGETGKGFNPEVNWAGDSGLPRPGLTEGTSMLKVSAHL